LLILSPNEAKELAGKMLNNRLVTKQTKPEGVEVKKVAFDFRFKRIK
jgi:hypothetical protein